MKSIIQSDKTKCFICEQNSSVEPLDEHHIFGGANRQLSEKYGLKVYLHHSKCHIFGNMSAHQNKEVSQKLHEIGQRAAMKHYNWTVEDFVKIFRKNYIGG